MTAEDIRILPAETVADVIAAAQQRIPAVTAAVIVNGRRLGDIADVNVLPPEAVERVEILPPSAGTRRGLGGRTPVINIVLKRQFRTLTGSAEAATSTDGGGDNERLQLIGAAIQEERRTNANLSGVRQGVLRYRDRFGSQNSGAMSEGADLSASLRPASRTLSFSAGKSLQFDQKQLALSASANLASSIREFGRQTDTQRNRSVSFSASATLSGQAGHHFWTAIANGSASRATANMLAIDNMANSNRSNSTGVDLAANLSGPFLKLPSGTALYNVNVAFATARLSQSIGEAPQTASGRRSVGSQIGLELPLHQRIRDGLSLGDVAVRLQAQFNHTTGNNSQIGYESALNWSPVRGFSLEWRSTSEAVGGNIQLGTVAVQPNVLLFDPLAQQNIRVRQIIGGNPALKTSSRRSSSLRANFNQKMLNTDVILSVDYAMERVGDPIFSPSPSLLIEDAFPGRFTRNAAGQLIEVDARPLNAHRQSSDTLSFNFSTLGQFGAHVRDSRLGADGNSMRWMLNMNYAVRLSQDLQLTSASPTIDLLSARISAFGGAGSRHMINAQAGLGNARFGTQLGVDWSSGTTFLGQGSSADGTYRQPLRVALDAHFNLGRGGTQAGGVGKVRLSLSIANLLNVRPEVRFPDQSTPFALLPANLDPLGRVIRLSLRTAIR